MSKKNKAQDGVDELLAAAQKNRPKFEWTHTEDGWWEYTRVINTPPRVEGAYYSLHQKSGEDVYFMRDTEAEISYLRSPDDKRSQYDDLFMWLDVPRYRWLELHAKIISVFGDDKYYDMIIENPEWWENVGTLVETWVVEQSETDPKMG